MSDDRDHKLAASRRVEAVIGRIECATDESAISDLVQRATEDISGLHSALARGRLQERVDDTANARLQELKDQSIVQEKPEEPNAETKTTN
jgi:hypothetical protein